MSILDQVKKIQILIGKCFSDAEKADKGFVTAGIRLRKQMKQIITDAHEVRKLVIQTRKEIEKTDEAE